MPQIVGVQPGLGVEVVHQTQGTSQSGNATERKQAFVFGGRHRRCWGSRAAEELLLVPRRSGAGLQNQSASFRAVQHPAPPVGSHTIPDRPGHQLSRTFDARVPRRLPCDS